MDDTAIISAKDVGERLKALRICRKIATRDLAAALEPIERRNNNIYHWEHGEYLPSWHYAVMLADIFEISMDLLFLGTPPQTCEHIEAETVGKRIKAHRKSQKITLKKLAEATGVNLSCITQWEADRCNPTLINAAMVCDALGVNLDELAGRL